MQGQRKRRVRVVLVDDHPLVRTGLVTILAKDPDIEVVAEAGTVAEGLKVLQRHKPDVVLLDVRLGNESGLSLCRQAEGAGLQAAFLVLTGFNDDETLRDALAAGAEGYILKSVDDQTLRSAVLEAAMGKLVMAPDVAERAVRLVGKEGAPSPAEDKVNLLSPQERRVLEQVALGKTNKEVAQAMGLTELTVRNYLSHALEKLGCTRRTQAAVVYSRYLNREGASTGASL